MDRYLLVAVLTVALGTMMYKSAPNRGEHAGKDWFDTLTLIFTILLAGALTIGVAWIYDAVL